MKIKYALVALFVGGCLTLPGALFKIEHWAGADLLLLTGMSCQATGVLGLLYKLLTHPRFRAFPNR